MIEFKRGITAIDDRSWSQQNSLNHQNSYSMVFEMSIASRNTCDCLKEHNKSSAKTIIKTHSSVTSKLNPGLQADFCFFEPNSVTLNLLKE